MPGTGASCIYPLLGATMNGWYFLATEVDDICFDYATKNVEQNTLSDLIKVVKVPQKTLLMDALKEETAIVYDFCMCNPPFFANQLEAKGVNSRNSRRPPPSSVNTGGVTEIMAEGGELEFVKRIIHDSLQLKTRLRWYSCMLGKKCSLAPLKEELRMQGVPKVTHTEFCQGRTMRWALAWSFYDDVIVPSPPNKRRKLEKVRKPLSFTLPEAGLKELRAKASALGCAATNSVNSIAALLEKILTDLRVLHKRLPCTKQQQSLFLTTVENTWIYGRQKRREQNRQLRELPRALPSAATGCQSTPVTTASATTPSSQNKQPSTQSTGSHQAKTAQELASQQQPAELTLNSSSTNKTIKEPEKPTDEQTKVSENTTGEDVDMESPTSTEAPKQPQAPATGQETGPEDVPAAAQEPKDTSQEVVAAKRPCTPDSIQHFLFKCVLNVMLEESDVMIEMHWVEGQNKDLMNQLCTYLKNTLLKTVGKP
ncbi:RNA N(6)-adenosine-methyltransferase mettl16 isoform 2-T2 [Polymixia lowei]